MRCDKDTDCKPGNGDRSRGLDQRGRDMAMATITGRHLARRRRVRRRRGVLSAPPIHGPAPRSSPLFALPERPRSINAGDARGRSISTARREIDLATRACLERIADGSMRSAMRSIDRRDGRAGSRPLGIERARTTGQLRLFADVVRAGEWLDLRIDLPLPERPAPPRAGSSLAAGRRRTGRGVRRQQFPARLLGRRRRHRRPPSRPAAR